MAKMKLKKKPAIRVATTTFRLEPAALANIDAAARKLTTERGTPFTRTAAIRTLFAEFVKRDSLTKTYES